MIREAGMEAAADAYVEANIYGTPEQCIEKYAYRHELIGDFLPTRPSPSAVSPPSTPPSRA